MYRRSIFRHCETIRQQPSTACEAGQIPFHLTVCCRHGATLWACFRNLSASKVQHWGLRHPSCLQTLRALLQRTLCMYGPWWPWCPLKARPGLCLPAAGQQIICSLQRMSSVPRRHNLRLRPVCQGDRNVSSSVGHTPDVCFLAL